MCTYSTSPPLHPPPPPPHLSTQLSIHGVPKTRTWTQLASSARAGDEQIVLQGNDYPDWQVGEEVVIAASQWDPEEAEIRTISNYDANSGTRDTHTNCGRKLDHLHTCTSSQPHTHTFTTHDKTLTYFHSPCTPSHPHLHTYTHTQAPSHWTRHYSLTTLYTGSWIPQT